MLARRFLWVVAGLTILLVIGALAYRLFQTQLMKVALIPNVSIKRAPGIDRDAERRADMGIARPGIAGNPSSWTPPGVKSEGRKDALVFFIHPTSFLEKSRWNAPLDDQESQRRARLFVQSQASAFNDVAEIWAPKYRQATF